MTRTSAGVILSGALIPYALIGPFYKFAHLYATVVLAGSATLSMIFLLVISSKQLPQIKSFPRKQIRVLFLSGILWGLMAAFYTASLSSLPASMAMILSFQFTWMLEAYQIYTDYRTNKKKTLNKVRLVAISSILVGAVLCSSMNMDELSKLNTHGVIFGFLSAICYTAALIVMERLDKDTPTLLKSCFTNFGQLLVVSCQLVVISIVSPEKIQASGSAEGWLWVALIGAIMAVDLYVYNKTTPYLKGTGLVGCLVAIELPASLFFSNRLLGEYISPLQWCGVCFILFGIVFVSLKNAEPKNTEPKTKVFTV
jgi:drug/metabolite transporter (DMT)-like permease